MLFRYAFISLKLQTVRSSQEISFCMLAYIFLALMSIKYLKYARVIQAQKYFHFAIMERDSIFNRMYLLSLKSANCLRDLCYNFNNSDVCLCVK